MEYNYDIEKAQAIDAGNRALRALRMADEELRKARNWGFIDMLGDGFIAGLIKHSKMNKANDYLFDARQELKNFSLELRDIHAESELNVDISGFMKFADIAFDNVFVDFMVQNTIKTARDQIEDAIERVEETLRRIG